MSDVWSNKEVELIVADYFNMLKDELTGREINKTKHRRQLIPILQNRSEGSIEFKHQNISAILINLGQPYIRGYLPRFNYQSILEDRVIDYLKYNSDIEQKFQQFTEKEISKPHNVIEFESLIVRPPSPSTEEFKEPKIPYHRRPIKINYLEREQGNQKLGEFGEDLVIKYEKWKLIKLGRTNLAEKVEWISKEEGDCAGFDILSKNLNGTDKYIEVKTTKLGKETPFFFSRNELQFSLERSVNYHLFRLFNADSNVKMFTKNGSLNQICNSVPIMFKGYF